jgi:hypothetical protein
MKDARGVSLGLPILPKTPQGVVGQRDFFGKRDWNGAAKSMRPRFPDYQGLKEL